jgi:hypothetical protein
MTFVLLGRDVVAPAVIREWCRLRCLNGKNTARDPQIREALQCADAMEQYRKDNLTLREVAAEIARHCSCGARPESPVTHPHVPGCPVYRLLKLVGLPATSVGDQYEKAVRPGNYDTSVGEGCDECGNTHGDAHAATCRRGK